MSSSSINSFLSPGEGTPFNGEGQPIEERAYLIQYANKFFEGITARRDAPSNGEILINGLTGGTFGYLTGRLYNHISERPGQAKTVGLIAGLGAMVLSNWWDGKNSPQNIKELRQQFVNNIELRNKNADLTKQLQQMKILVRKFQEESISKVQELEQQVRALQLQLQQAQRQPQQPSQSQQAQLQPQQTPFQPQQAQRQPQQPSQSQQAQLQPQQTPFQPYYQTQPFYQPTAQPLFQPYYQPQPFYQPTAQLAFHPYYQPQPFFPPIPQQA